MTPRSTIFTPNCVFSSWMMTDLVLKRTDSPFSSNYLLSIALEWFFVSTSPLHSGICFDLGLHGSCTCGHTHCGLCFQLFDVSGRHCFFVIIHHLRIEHYPTTSSSTMIPEPREEGVWHRCPIWGWSFPTVLFSAPWPVWVFVLIYYLLQIGVSLMMIEKYINLWVWW